MTIGFDATHFTGVSGIETYARNLVRAMAQSFPDDRIVLFTTRNKSDEVSAIVNDCPNIRVDGCLLHPLALGDAGAGIVQWLRRRTWRRVARTCDVVHFPDPLHFVDGIPNGFVTVHDVIPAYHEPWASSATSRRQVDILSRIARGNAHVIVPSEFVKRECVRVFGIAAHRIHCVYEGADALFTPQLRDEVLLQRFRLGPSDRYFLVVGRLDPRKNLERTIEAFALAAPDDGQMRFVIAGRGNASAVQSLKDCALRNGVADRVRFVDDAGDADLAQLYSGAIALVFVSLSEGFGLPAIEAMQCGCPVIASNVSSLPEIVGGAGLVVDPKDAKGIANAMRTLAGDRERCRTLREAGLERAKDFSWEQAARDTRGAYRATAR